MLVITYVNKIKYRGRSTVSLFDAYILLLVTAR